MTLKTIKISASIILASMLASTAYAEDWSGIYMGGSISMGEGEIEGTDFTTKTQRTLPMSGNLYGLHFGYNHDFDKIVLGGEMSFSGGKYTFDGVDFNGVESEASIRDIRDAKLRIGYDAEKVMPYLVAGASTAKAYETDSDSSSIDFKGYGLGAGIEYLYRPNIVLGVEYYQRNLEAIVNGEASSDNSLSLNDIILRVSYKF